MAEQTKPQKLTLTGLLLLVCLALLYLMVAWGHTYLAPLTTGPDELAHYEYVRFIAEHGRLPQTYAEREAASYKSDQPPLYHLITALPASLVDPSGPPFLKRVYDHPRRQLIERTRHSWGLYNTEDELWPYRAEVLRWQVGRWVAVLFGLGTVIITFFIARYVFARILPDLGVAPALGAAMVVAFIPRFALTGSMLNYETTIVFFSSLYLWVLLKFVSLRSYRWWHFVWLGLFMGLAITTKLSAIILPLETLVALWLIERYAKNNADRICWRFWLKNVFITFVAAGLVVAMWFGFVVYHFNTVAEDGWYVGLLRPLIAADASDATTNRILSLLTGGEAGFTAAIENLDSGPPWEWAAIFFRTFWVAGIEQHVPLGWVGLGIALLMCLLAGYGLVMAWRNTRIQPDAKDPAVNRASRLILLLLLTHLLSPLVLPLVRYVVTSSLADTAQGRHVLFMAAPAFAVLLVWGILASVYRLMRTSSWAGLRLIALIPGVFLLGWTLVQLWVMSWAYVPLLPVRTVPEARAQAVEPGNHSFNDYVTLIGYNDEFANRMLRLDLIWQATQVSPFDYLTQVNLVDTQGNVQAQWLGHPAGGRYPTRTWDVGDIVRDTVWLPLHNLEAGEYQIELNLVPTNLNPSLESMSGSITLTTISISDLAQPQSSQVQVWQNGQPLTAPQMFRYRETILVTFDPALLSDSPVVQVVRADGLQTFDPVQMFNNSALFIIGPDWTSGDYGVRITTGSGQQITSESLIRLIDRWERQFDPPPMQHAVEANFANQVKLLGYDLGANRAEPDGGIPVTLYWQGLDWMGNDYTIFAKLLAADQTVHGGDERLPQEGYHTLYWAPGEIVVDPFGVPVAGDAPDGVYTINVGLYRKVEGQAVSLSLVQDGQLIEASSVNIGPVKIGKTPPGLTLTAAEPQHVLNQPFGDAPHLTLLGYDLTEQENQLGLTLYWRSETALPVDYTTFVHLRDLDGQTVAQKDQPPLNGAYPTSLWDSGEIIADEIIITLPDELPAGEYQLVMGMYDFNTGQRLSVPDCADNEFLLITLEYKR